MHANYIPKEKTYTRTALQKVALRLSLVTK